MSLFEELKKKLEYAASPEGVEQTRQFLGMPSGEEIVKRTQEGRYALNPLEALGIVGRPIESVTAAPARAAISSLQGNLDMSEAMKAFANQFGRNVDLAPTGEQIAEKAGLQGKAAAAAGLGLDVAIDPSSIMGGAALKALPLLGLAGTVAKAGKIEKAAEVGSVLAKQDPLGFYSKLEDVILSKMGKSATPEQVMSIAKGAKEEEVAVSGLADFLKGKEKVTQEEVLQQIRENRPHISESIKGPKTQLEGANLEALRKAQDNLRQKIAIDDLTHRDFHTNLDKMRAALRGAKVDRQIIEDATYYAQIGGSNWKDLKAKISSDVPADLLDAIEEQSKAVVKTRNELVIADEHLNNLLADLPTGEPTKFAKWQEPGGKNYREVLLTYKPPLDKAGLAARKEIFDKYQPQIEALEEKYYDAPNAWHEDALAAQGEAQALMAERDAAADAAYRLPKDNEFQSSHWSEPNVLAHARVNERVDEAGKKLLHVEEIQSDWHQQGRTQGYLTDEQNKLIEQATKVSEKAKFDFKRASVELKNSGLLNEVQDLGYDTSDQAIYAILKDPDWTKTYDLRGANEKLIPMANDLREKFKKVTESSNELVKLKSKELVPDAPFKKNWMELMAKRLIRQAVDSGADRMSWTPGAKQAARYKLSKQVDEIQAFKNKDGTFDIEAWKGGDLLVEKSSLNKQALEETLGKELAAKIASESGEKLPLKGGLAYSGKDLELGGEGMKGFYDKMLPDFLRKFGKKYGAEVGETTADGMKVPFLELTPELKKAIKEEGSSLFQVGGAVTLPMLMEKMRRDREAESAP